MCGINGTFVFNQSHFEVTESYLNTMRDQMIHRGPDGAGIWISPNKKIGFGHRRLAIIDLNDSAAQPMCNHTQTIWITFNGEIYNHAEVRRELENLGYRQWKTNHSDTEVIIYAYQEWGIECIHKFRGMFAFALWDDHKKTLWLVRDRIGIKPLYYSIHHGRLVFASEIKALLKDPTQQRAVNEESLFHYLSFLTTPAPNTLFKDIYKLPAGTLLQVKCDGSVIPQTYWDVWDNTSLLEIIDENKLAEMVLSELETAVQLRSVSDVPVGVFLSGGIDSSVNASLFQKNKNDPIKTFSIGYEGQYKGYQNELMYASRVANSIGANHFERILNAQDMMNFLPSMIYHQDEPISDPVCMPLYYVSALARQEKVIVAQVGEGADELFCGYPSWSRALHLQKIYSAIPGNWLKQSAAFIFGMHPKFRHTNTLEQLTRAGRSQPIFWSGAESFSERQKRRVLHPALKKQFRNFSSWEVIEPIYKRFIEKAPDQSALNWMGYIDLKLRLPELLLMRVDKMSMATSIEARVPFLDHRFVELAMKIPPNLRFKNNELKYLLKKAVRGVIPDDIIDRKKQGFGVPIQDWYFDKLGVETKNILDKFCKETQFFDPREIKRMYEGNNKAQLWYLLNFALWHQQFISC